MNEIIFWSSIYPSWYIRAIGCYQLAYWLRMHNVECQVIDFCQWYTADELFALTVPFIGKKTKYIGITSSFWPNQIVPTNILNAIQLIKQQFPHIKIVIGGPRANYPDIKQHADLSITGEAEDKILQLFDIQQTQPFNIVSLSHRYHRNDCILEGEPLPIELGRGCVFKCNFCAHHNLGKPKKTYQRKMDLILDEMAYNYEMFKTKHYLFIDDTVNEDPEKIRLLSTLPNQLGIDISWTGYLRADLIWRFPETAHQLQASGLSSCFFGIESFSPDASNAIGKGWSGKYAKEFLPKLYANIWDKKISIHNNFIVGLPKESKASLEETLTWCLQNPMGSHIFVALGLYHPNEDYGPKSEFVRNYSKYGYELLDTSNWKNDIMDSLEAEAICASFNSRLLKINKFTSWRLFDLLNISINIDFAKNKQIAFPSYAAKKILFSPFLKRYTNALNTLS